MNLPEGYKRHRPAGGQSPLKPRELQILPGGQDSLTKVKRGDSDLTKETRHRPQRPPGRIGITLHVPTACVFGLLALFCCLLCKRADLGGTGDTLGQALRSYVPMGCFWQLVLG